MEYSNSKRTLSTRQAMWKKQWIDVFLNAGIDHEEAEKVFNINYGIQEINIFTDPIEEAHGLTGITKKIEISS